MLVGFNILEHCGEEELVKEKPNDSKTKKVAKQQNKNENKNKQSSEKVLRVSTRTTKNKKP